MINRITIENFKSLRKVDLKLGRLNLFIGANASGKSNFLDALRVLQGIGYGLTIGEIFNGKPEGATNVKWEKIRGGSRFAKWVRADDADDISIRVNGRSNGDIAGISQLHEPGSETSTNHLDWTLDISLRPTEDRVTRESFAIDSKEIYRYPAMHNPDGRWADYFVEPGHHGTFEVDSQWPILQQFANVYSHGRLYDDLPREHPTLAARAGHTLANSQWVEPLPSHLQEYGDTSTVHRLGNHGENFASIVETIVSNGDARDVYLSWLQELRPEEVGDVDVLHGAVGEPLFMLRENGSSFPAPVLSEGTLRFAALVAGFFQPVMPRLMMVEEIERGIHAGRLRLLLELMRDQASETDTQIVATTHSASLLDWLSKDDYRTTFFCKRDEDTGESHMRPLADVPRFMEVVKNKPASELLSAGWLEMAL